MWFDESHAYGNLNRCILAMLKNWGNKGTEGIGLVTPTPVLYAVLNHIGPFYNSVRLYTTRSIMIFSIRAFVKAYTRFRCAGICTPRIPRYMFTCEAWLLGEQLHMLRYMFAIMMEILDPTGFKSHCIMVTPWWARWRHKSPASPLFTQPFIQGADQRILTPKLRVTGLCGGNSLVTGEFPAQRASNAENVSIRWRHHVTSDYCYPYHPKLLCILVAGIAIVIAIIIIVITMTTIFTNNDIVIIITGMNAVIIIANVTILSLSLLSFLYHRH